LLKTKNATKQHCQALKSAGRRGPPTPTWLLYQSLVGFLLAYVKLFQSIVIGFWFTCRGRSPLRPAQCWFWL